MKAMRILFATLVAICTCTWSCSSDLDENPTNGSIFGTVSDKTTGDPVATVSMALSPGGMSTVTGSDGSYTFDNLESGDYEITISKEGYNSISYPVHVNAGEPTPAHLLIERIPSIVTADRDQLDFGDNPSNNTMSFNIVNRTYEDLEWTIEERCDWIVEVKPIEGVLKYGKTEGIIVVIDRNKLEPGENKSSIVIRSTNGSSQLAVTAIGADNYMPQLNTLATTDIKAQSATINGEIANAGNPEYTERGFVYSLTSMPTVENTIRKITCQVNSTKKYSYTLNGLELDKTYYVRAYAKNAVGIAYSTNEVSFKTRPTLPVVKTLEIYNPDMANGTATFRGQITSVGEPAYTERGFVYSEIPSPTINDNKIIANGAGVEGSFSKSVSNLPRNGYYVRAYATSIGGTAYGEEQHVAPEWIALTSAGIAVQCNDLGYGDHSTAVAMCENSILGGYTDWRLPTKDELMILYTNRELIGGFLNQAYWASDFLGIDSFGNESYKYIDFNNGQLSSALGRYQYRVRAVRTLK